MAEDRAMEKISSEDEDDKNRKKKKEDYLSDPEFFSCVLQPSPADSDPEYIGIRRLLLHRKARGRWISSPAPFSLSFEVDSLTSSRHILPMRIICVSINPSSQNSFCVYLSFYFLNCVNTCSHYLQELRSGNQALSHRLSFSTNASDSDRPHIKRAEPAYSFVGMHCIFDQCKAMVTVVKFGHMSSDILAYGASDGTLTVCNVSEPPSIIKQLIGHSKDVTDFDFTSSNQYIASSSMDKTVRIWEISKGLCIRVMYGVTSQLCIRFHPVINFGVLFLSSFPQVNNNFLSVGNANKEITVFNFSTGRVICKTVFDNEVTAMDHDHTGQLIFCGDAQGSVYSVSMDSRTGSLSRTHTHRSGNKHKSPVSTMQYRTFSLLARGPVLLAFTQDGNLSFFSVALEVQGYLTIRCSLQLSSRLHSIRASFCPLLSLEKGEYIGTSALTA
ncbi:hypothetical protein C3L33_19817, partial [Rhododendron williamsianum]